jgi:P pilus assembly chaperone PapD
MRFISRSTLFLLALLVAGWATSAGAELVLSQVVVDLGPDKPARENIELFNSGTDRLYVAADPFEIRNPGAAEQQRTPAANPQQSGLLVTPQRLILEPGERRLVRIAAVVPRPAADSVYRVTIRPVAGEVSANADALKVFVGYDVLVIYRPAAMTGALEAHRDGARLVIANRSNTSQELFDGRQCDAAGRECRALTGRRLYPGTEWAQDLPYGTPVTYRVAVGERISQAQF